MMFADLPSEAIMRIASFTPHPCAEIMQGCYCGETWFDWLERFEHRRQQNYLLAVEEEYAREEGEAGSSRSSGDAEGGMGG